MITYRFFLYFSHFYDSKSNFCHRARLKTSSPSESHRTTASLATCDASDKPTESPTRFICLTANSDQFAGFFYRTRNAIGKSCKICIHRMLSL